jgi:hypothetical protein
MPTRAEKIRADLLNASFEYIQGRRAFEGAITAARSLGWSDGEIADITGLSRSMVQSVSPPPQPGTSEPPSQ